MNNCILLYSGGFDSTIAVRLLIDEGYTVYPLFINYGQKALKCEREAVDFFCSYFDLPLLKTYNITEYGSYVNHPLLNYDVFDGIQNSRKNYSSNYLPFRNLLFSCIAAIYCSELNINNLAFGFTKKESYEKFPDTSPLFLTELESLIAVVEPENRIKAFSPTITYTKTELARIADNMNIPYQKCYSCYNENICNICESCVELKNALEASKQRDYNTESRMIYEIGKNN